MSMLLKTCPVCNSKAILKKIFKKGYAYIECSNCCIRTKKVDGEIAKDAKEFVEKNSDMLKELCENWNHRPEEEIVIEIDEDKEEIKNTLKQMSGIISNIQYDINKIKNDQNASTDAFSNEEIQTIEDLEDIANYVITMEESKYANDGKTIGEIYIEDKHHLLYLGSLTNPQSIVAEKDIEQINNFIKIMSRIFQEN